MRQLNSFDNYLISFENDSVGADLAQRRAETLQHCVANTLEFADWFRSRFNLVMFIFWQLHLIHYVAVMNNLLATS